MTKAMENRQIRKRASYFKRRSLSKASVKEKIIIGVVLLIFSLYAISLIYPFLYLLLNSFKTGEEVTGSFDWVTFTETKQNLFWFTKKPTLENYKIAATGMKYVKGTILDMYLNTILLSVGETLVSMFMTCSAAYVLAKYQFKGNKLIYTIILIATFIPAISSLPAIYKMMYNQNFTLANKYIGMLIVNTSAFGGPFLYIHSYFKVIPWSFAESAMMDGAGDFRIFAQIMVPLAKNGILTFTLLRFLGYWNDYYFPYIFYGDHPTLAVGIAQLTDNGNDFQVVCAAMILAIVPVLIFYGIFQKRLLANTVDGGLK